MKKVEDREEQLRRIAMLIAGSVPPEAAKALAVLALAEDLVERFDEDGALRHLAMRIAGDVPEDREDALTVLAYARELIEWTAEPAAPRGRRMHSLKRTHGLQVVEFPKKAD